MRVRLIKPVLVEIEQLDTAATKAAGNYDPDFGTVRVGIVNGKRRALAIYKDPIRLRGQVEDQTMDSLRMFGAGNSPEAKLAVTFAISELREHRLLDPDTDLPLLNVNDRLRGFYSLRSGAKVFALRAPGLYAIEVRPASVGLNGEAGIVVVRFNDRALSEAPG